MTPDKMYSDLLLLGYERMLLDTLTDKEICELWHKVNPLNVFAYDEVNWTT